MFNYKKGVQLVMKIYIVKKIIKLKKLEKIILKF